MAIVDKIKKIAKREEPAASAKAEAAAVSAKKEGAKSAAGVFYGVLKQPHITEKASMASQFNKYVFKVSKDSNKPEIKKAIEKIYEVTVENINIMNMPGKKVRLGRQNEGRKAGFKKAIVSLKEGDKIDIGV